MKQTPTTSLRLNTAWAGAQVVGYRGEASANFHASSIIWDTCIQRVPCQPSHQEKLTYLHLFKFYEGLKQSVTSLNVQGIVTECSKGIF